MHFQLLAVALAVAPFASAQLNELAKKAGKKYFGTATDNPELSNTRYYEILTDTSEFGCFTPSNGMKVSDLITCVCTLSPGRGWTPFVVSKECS